MMAILDRLAREDRSRLFALPVSDRQAPGYSEIIKTPMCFADVQVKLEKLAYSDVGGDGGIGAFKDDLNLIWRNAKAYNAPTHNAWRLADRLQKLSGSFVHSSFHGGCCVVDHVCCQVLSLIECKIHHTGPHCWPQRYQLFQTHSAPASPTHWPRHR
jgi:hypothetical protein